MQRKVFEKINLGGIEVNNRIVRSATAEVMADLNGYMTQNILNMYSDLCEGNIGLIITGLTEIVEGTFTHTMMKIHDDSYIEGLKKLTDLVHSKGNKIVSQLVSHGSQLLADTGYIPFSPSGIEMEGSPVQSREITKEEIKKVVGNFGDAALRAKKAGFDGVQIHAGHGYLFSRFLTPLFNKRTDEYGGCIENRGRIILEAYENIRKKCGKDFPIFIKMNVCDFLEEDGLTFEDGKKLAKILSDVGMNAIEITGGLSISKHSPSRVRIKSKDEEAYHREFASEIAKTVDSPVIVVGGFRSLDVIEEVINDTEIAAVSLSRPFIIEPNLVTRWIEGDTKKSKCISCNKCYNINGTSCVFSQK